MSKIDTLRKPQQPKSSDDWATLHYEIAQLFDGSPIDDEDLFAGRMSEVARIVEATLSRSNHVVLFGEKGVGKTSLANVFWKRFGGALQSSVVARIQVDPGDTFESIWFRALDELQAVARLQGKPHYVPYELTDDVDITPTNIRRALSIINPNAIPIIIMDEFNELDDPDAKKLTANVIKQLYDYAIHTTVILVGVAESISELLDGHQSLDRTLVQIPLNRMSELELREIISKRESQLPVTFHPDAVWTIVTLSRGLPFFTQTLSKHAAMHAVIKRRLQIVAEDVQAGMDKFVEDSGQSFEEAYRTAIRSNQANHFKESLLACALAKTDDEGWFAASDVLEPYCSIMGEKKAIAHYEKHLKRFSGSLGGFILQTRGGDRRQQFRFFDPMMQPFVIIQGIQSNMVDDAARATLLEKAQGSLPI